VKFTDEQTDGQQVTMSLHKLTWLFWARWAKHYRKVKTTSYI